MAQIPIYDPSMLVWIDETGCDQLSSLRKYGCSIKGIPPQDHRILVHGKKYSTISVMAVEGVRDVDIVEGLMVTDS